MKDFSKRNKSSSSVCKYFVIGKIYNIVKKIVIKFNKTYIQRQFTFAHNLLLNGKSIKHAFIEEI